MRPRRTHNSDFTFTLAGGTEDNDLWVERVVSDHGDAFQSVWEPTPEERERIANGENIYLIVWFPGHPPVAMGVTDQPLGKAPDGS